MVWMKSEKDNVGSFQDNTNAPVDCRKPAFMVLSFLLAKYSHVADQVHQEIRYVLDCG
jgi:hypothetical protein